jgi:tetratricopeptide (TPR) repeat protein
MSRGITQLLNQYYFLKNKNPYLAKTTLTILLQEYPNNVTGLSEMGYWYISQKQPAQALPYLTKAFNLTKDHQLALQIAFILNSLNRNEEASVYFKFAAKSPNVTISQKAQRALQVLTPSSDISAGYALIPPIIQSKKPILASQKPLPTADLFNLYYYLKKTNLNQAEDTLNVILKREPNNVAAIIEMGYLKLAQNNKPQALTYFLNAFSKNKTNYQLALQIGYLLNELKRNQDAIPYFSYATHSTDEQIKQKALNALRVLQPSLLIQQEQAQKAVAYIPPISKPKPSATVELPRPAIFEQTHQSTVLILFDRFYILKRSNPHKAEKMLEQILKIEPNNTKALAEMGYLMIALKKQKEATYYFERLWSITHHTKYALQAGYLLAGLGKKDEAISYFRKAHQQGNEKEKNESTKALSVLAKKGGQPKTLIQPKPEKQNEIAEEPIELPKTQVSEVETKTSQVQVATNLMAEYYQLKKTNVAKAKKILHEVLAKEPNNVIALKEAGYLELKLGNKKAAIGYLTKVNELQPTDEIRLQLGYIYYSLGQPIEAKKYFAQASTSKNTKTKQQALKALAVINQVAAKSKSIILPEPTVKIPEIKKATEVATKTTSQVVANLMNEYYQLKKTNISKAREVLQEVLAKEPSNVIALKEAGYLELKLGDKRAAVGYLTRVNDLQPTDEIRLQIGYIYYSLGQREEAKKYFTLVSNSKNTKTKQQALKALAVINQIAPKSKGTIVLQPTVIIPEIKQATEVVTKTTSQVVANLMNEYYQLKKTDASKAKKILQEVLAKEPNNVIALKEAGYLELKLGDKSAAVGYLTRVNDLQPTDEIRLQIGYIYYSLGQRNEAIKYFALVSNSKNTKTKQQALNALAVLNQATKPLAGTTAVQPPTKIPEPKQGTEVAAQTTSQTVTNLMNEYYKQKKINAGAAKNILLKILQLDPKNVMALNEMAYFELTKGDKALAVKYLAKSYELKPDDKIALQLGYTLALLKRDTEAEFYFKKSATSKDSEIRKKSLAAIKVLEDNKKAKSIQLPQPPKITQSTYLLNKFYKVKKKDKLKARCILFQILKLEPNNVKVLKELGYLDVELKDNCGAYQAFNKVFDLTCDYTIASQLGYISDALNLKKEAYTYFWYASYSPDKKLSLKGNEAMTNLSGWQYRMLPDPFFVDFYFSPLYYSRFDLSIFPQIFRAGFYVDKDKRAEIYSSIRATRDSRSVFAVLTPQIYEDDVAIFALGGRYKVFKKTPLYIYLEGGRAYDLIFRDRERWRGDLRGGFIYFDRFGRKATYTDKLRVPFKYQAEVYGDSTYYSRYQGNVITTLRARPGLRILEYKAGYLDVYMKLLGTVDTKHFFYNNFIEHGPGVVLVPYNRINFDIRFETVRANYIKVGGPFVNPYGTHYNTKYLYLELYVKF